MLLLAIALAGCAAGGVPPSSTAAVPAKSAWFSRYEYHYDRNALASCALIGSSLLATTEAGHLLLFDGRSFGLKGQLLSARKARFVVPAGTNSALVAFENGRIARIDVGSFAMETLAVVPGVPVWLGIWRNQPVVAYGQPLSASWSRFRERLSAYRVREIASGRDVLLDETPSAFLIDGKDRLWMGADYGEWGGALQVLDLTSGSLRELPEWGGLGVYGFAEPVPAVVWAMGGVSHMLMQDAFVTRVAPEPVKKLYRFEGLVPLFAKDQKRWLLAPEPRSAITHAFARPTGEFWLLSQHHWIEANSKLNRFKRLADLALNNVRGRPDAVGNYPAVRAAVMDGDRIVLATRLDGFVTLENGSAVPHARRRELVGSPSWALAVPSGTLFWGEGGGTLRTADSAWKMLEARIESTESDRLALSAERTPSTDPDLIAAQRAIDN